MKDLKFILSAIFPFAVTILLWRLSVPFWNPMGVLAIVPIFYYSFVKSRPEFLPMAIIGCFLMDHNFGTFLFWVIFFCATYSANYLQTSTRPFVETANGQFAFMGFVGAALLLLGLSAFTWGAFATMIWMFIITNVFYYIWARYDR